MKKNLGRKKKTRKSKQLKNFKEKKIFDGELVGLGGDGAHLGDEGSWAPELLHVCG